METENLARGFKGVWIPRQIYHDKSLSWTQKILLIEIDSLDSSEKGCYASNKYLADFLGCSEKTVANIICELKKRSLVKQLWFNGRERGLRVVNERESGLPKIEKADFQKSGKRTSQNRESGLPEIGNLSYKDDNNRIVNKIENSPLPPNGGREASASQNKACHSSLQTGLESEKLIWLAATAPLLGAKSRETMPSPAKWLAAIEKAVREQHNITDWLGSVKSEVARNKGTPQFLTPDGCLKALQTKKIKSKENGFLH